METQSLLNIHESAWAWVGEDWVVTWIGVGGWITIGVGVAIWLAIVIVILIVIVIGIGERLLGSLDVAFPL